MELRSEKPAVLLWMNAIRVKAMKLPAASGGVSSGIPPKPTRLRSMSFGAVRLAIHPCGKPQGILAKANKKAPPFQGRGFFKIDYSGIVKSTGSVWELILSRLFKHD